MAAKIIFFIFLILFSTKSFADDLFKVYQKDNYVAEIKILDKITSRLEVKKFKLKNINRYKDFEFFIDKCVVDTRKGFREVLALVQIKDFKNKSKDTVFLFNGWMFKTNPALNEFEHPNYDIWLNDCYKG